MNAAHNEASAGAAEAAQIKEALEDRLATLDGGNSELEAKLSAALEEGAALEQQLQKLDAEHHMHPVDLDVCSV